MNKYKLFWGDTHLNIHENQLDRLDDTLAFGREMLDFLPMAYYPYRYSYMGKMKLEDWIEAEKLAPQWKTICDFIARVNRPDEFVTFPGFEWHGDGSHGDHNVFFLADHPPLFRSADLPELYADIRKSGLKAMAIPHHIAYLPGIRSKDWSVQDDELSPFAEIYSEHGCSESDEEWIGLRKNRNMGPGVSGGSMQDGLDRGCKVGIICSSDAHETLPGVYGKGTMACWSKELTRESLWDAFANRRVYGVTGDKIELEFSVESAPMGSIIRRKGTVRIAVAVRCTDALDRIELLRNNRVIATHCHQGTWETPADGIVRCKLRIEAGWNTHPQLIPDQPPRKWNCSIRLDGGTVIGEEKCWKTLGQRVGKTGSANCDFGFTTMQALGGGVHTEATVFEIEARPADRIELDIDGKAMAMTLAEAMRGSRIVHWTAENAEVVRRVMEADPAKLPRPDWLYFMGPKAKIHRAIPQAGLSAVMEHADANPPGGTNHYRVRVTQRNRHVAWSSPVWVEN